MRIAGNLNGSADYERRFPIGASVVADQVVCADVVIARTGPVVDPASANDYSEMVGLALEAGTYSTTQGTGASSANVLVRVGGLSHSTIYQGRVSGGATAGTAFAETTDGNLLTNTTASAGGTLITDADVGTSEFEGGYVIALNGNNRGQIRSLNAHTDNTSTAVAVPFDFALAVNDTFLRTFGPFMQGLEITSNFVEFNGTPGAAVDLPDTGHAVVLDVLIDIDGKKGGTSAAPVVDVLWIAADHAFNSLA